MRRVIANVAVYLVLMCGVVHAANENAEKAAVAAAKSWLQLVDAGKYDESWREAAGYFKKAVTTAQWTQSMQAVREPLGKLVSREVKGARHMTSLPGAPDGEYVVIQFKTSYANKKSAIETVTPTLDKDGKWRGSGYYIK